MRILQKKIRQNKIFLISLSVVLLDQVSKFLLSNFLIDKSSILVLPHLVRLTLVENRGAAFSLFSQSTLLLAFISLIVSIVLVVLIINQRSMTMWKGLGMALLLGGSIGNGIDRWILGYVIDFIQLIPINFPIFNFADISINLAVLCFILETRNKKSSQNAEKSI